VNKLESLIACARELVKLIEGNAEQACCIPWIFASDKIERLLEQIENTMLQTARWLEYMQTGNHCYEEKSFEMTCFTNCKSSLASFSVVGFS